MVASLSGLDRDVSIGGSYVYVIKRGGKLEELEFSSEDSIIPNEEMYRSLELFGVSPETRTSTFDDKEFLRLPILVRIIDESDDQHKGIFRTEIPYDFTGPRSTIGQMATAILGEPWVEKITQEFWDKMIGGRFGATLNLKEKGDRTYISLVHGSFKPVKQKSAKAAAAPAASPFDDDEE